MIVCWTGTSDSQNRECPRIWVVDKDQRDTVVRLATGRLTSE